MKWYLAGPMSGIPDHNYPAFKTACLLLRGMGLDIMSPHETFPNQDGAIPWVTCLRHDVGAVAQCDGLILLAGWSRSRGARLEFHLAVSLEMPIKFLDFSLSDETFQPFLLDIS